MLHMQRPSSAIAVRRAIASAVVASAAIVFSGAVLAAGDTRLADAAMNRDMVAVRALLAQKVDVNAPGPTARRRCTGSSARATSSPRSCSSMPAPTPSWPTGSA